MKRLHLAILSLSLLAAHASVSWAWISMDGDSSPPHTAWATLPVHWSMNSAGSADLGPATSETALIAGFDEWGSPACTSWAHTYDGTSSSMPNGGDGRNVQGWVESGWRFGSGAIGVTSAAFGGGYSIVEADIAYNGVNYTWTTSGGSGYTVDAQSIATHEEGHFLGLGDLYGSACAGDPTMCGVYSGGTGARTIATDDINGVCALYPSGAADCTTDDDCPPGEHCEDGWCVPDPDPLEPCDPCTAHEECGGENDMCLSGFPDGGMYCGKACTTAADCPAGFDCIEIGGAPANQCVPATMDCSDIPECANDDDCPEGMICVDGTCVEDTTPECTTDEDCPEGEICQDGECVPDPSPHLPWCSVCSTHEECGGPDDLCLGGFVDGTSRCGISCDSVWGDCGEGKVCYHFDDAPDQCIPEDMDCSGSTGECTEDADCPPGQVCQDGTCVTPQELRMVSGCGCTLAGAPGGGAGLAILLALALGLGGLVRRRP